MIFGTVYPKRCSDCDEPFRVWSRAPELGPWCDRCVAIRLAAAPGGSLVGRADGKSASEHALLRLAQLQASGDLQRLLALRRDGPAPADPAGLQRDERSDAVAAIVLADEQARFAYEEKYGETMPFDTNEEAAFVAFGELRVTDLSGRDLSGTNLSYLRFYGAKFDGADLTKASLVGARMSHEFFGGGCSFVGARCDDADFSGADLRYASASRISAARASFRSADLRGANLAEANLQGADFTGANLVGTNLDGAKLLGAKLVNARK